MSSLKPDADTHLLVEQLVHAFICWIFWLLLPLTRTVIVHLISLKVAGMMQPFIPSFCRRQGRLGNLAMKRWQAASRGPLPS